MNYTINVFFKKKVNRKPINKVIAQTKKLKMAYFWQ